MDHNSLGSTSSLILAILLLRQPNNHNTVLQPIELSNAIIHTLECEFMNRCKLVGYLHQVSTCTNRYTHTALPVVVSFDAFLIGPQHFTAFKFQFLIGNPFSGKGLNDRKRLCFEFCYSLWTAPKPPPRRRSGTRTLLLGGAPLYSRGRR